MRNHATDAQFLGNGRKKGCAMIGLRIVSLLVAALVALQPGGQAKIVPERKKEAPNKKITRIAHRIAHSYYREMVEYGHWLPMLQKRVDAGKAGMWHISGGPENPYSDPEFVKAEIDRLEDEVQYMLLRKKLMEGNLDEWMPRLTLEFITYFCVGRVDCERTRRGERRLFPTVIKVVGKDGLLVLSSHWPFDRPCPIDDLPKPSALMFRHVPTKGIKPGQEVELTGVFECIKEGAQFNTKEYGRLQGSILEPVREEDFEEALRFGRELIREGKCGPKRCELCAEIGKRLGRIEL